MQAVIKSIKFKGYKKFSDWVKLDFEINPNKYTNKMYLKKMKYDDKTNFNYNAITGLTGGNASGKTTTLDILEKYVEYLNTGKSPFNKEQKRIDPFARNHEHNDRDRNQGPGQMGFLTPGKMRELFRSKISQFVDANSSFNVNSDVIAITVEIVTEGLQIIHELEFAIDGSICEKIYTKKRINKNETTQQIFNKSFENEINFKTFSSLIDSNEIIVHNKTSNFSKEIVNLAAKAITEIANSFVETEHFDLLFFKLSSNLFFDNPDSETELMNRVKVMESVIQLIDDSILEAKINQKYNNFIEFEFLLKDGAIISENSLSTGTIKFTNFILKAMYFWKKEYNKTKYILIDEIDNSWNPNLTKTFIQLFKLPFLKDFNLICTFQNPYISSEFREDSLYIINKNSAPVTWVQFINDYNKEHPDNKLRLEHSFAKKYLDDFMDPTLLESNKETRIEEWLKILEIININ